jgi:hypothetical protein
METIQFLAVFTSFSLVYRYRWLAIFMVKGSSKPWLPHMHMLKIR